MNLLAEFHWVVACLGFVAGGILTALFLKWRELGRARTLETDRRSVLDGTRREVEAVMREARLTAAEETGRLRQQMEAGFADRCREANETQTRLDQREALVNLQLEGLVERERNLREQQRELQSAREILKATESEAGQLLAERREQLARVAGMSESDARAQLLREAEQASLRDAADLTRRVVDEARAHAEEKARRIVGLAIQRYAGEHTFETTTATVALTGDEIKGRIIGREGRNIRAFEAATGVTVLIDDTPGAVVLSGFDPVKREIARQAMERLVQDGRIHPTRIEEVVGKVKEEVDELVIKAGEEAVFKTGLPPVHSEIVKVLGRLKFRYSFSQNILDHSIEVAQLAALLAAELGVDVVAAKRAGLLHDIGKAINHEVEGSHALIGADLIRRYGEVEGVVNAVAAHHDEVPHVGLIGILVSAADAISASRPGARSETMSTYLSRLESLERLGSTFEGVEKCYAVQAGREIRVIVRPDQINDDQAYRLARDVARRIEDELMYPGQIRVTVIRETRCVEFAK
ncbi:MAG: ribonuclease Y [Limisphaerales bacterium]